MGAFRAVPKHWRDLFGGCCARHTLPALRLFNLVRVGLNPEGIVALVVKEAALKLHDVRLVCWTLHATS
jgi:hypothetical protein